MPLLLTKGVEKLHGINRHEFQEKFMIPQRPVIIKNLFGDDAPVYSKWTFDFFKKELGHLDVGIFDVEGTKRQDDRSYKSAPQNMKFSAYLDLIQKGPTSKRLFLFNVFKHRKDLFNDFEFPDIADRVLRKVPMAFFGGAGAVTRIHRDMDNSNVFLTELYGKKRVVLFHPKYSEMLYRLPFSTHTYIDINNPDYDRFPALDKVEGYDCILEAGETLFMPSGWWHHIEYQTAGIGFSVRAISPKTKDFLIGLYQIGLLTHLDEILRLVLGDRWYEYKKTLAERRALNALYGSV